MDSDQDTVLNHHKNPDRRIEVFMDPFVPSGWHVLAHRRHIKGNRTLFWNPPKDIRANQDENISPGELSNGAALFEKYRHDSSVFNAVVLDHLLQHTHLIPYHWVDLQLKHGPLFFWGTLYANNDGHHAVRCLIHTGKRWDMDHCFWKLQL